MSVLVRAFFAFNAARTFARLSSLLLIAASEVGEPGAVSCCERSGSLNQRSENFGTLSFQRTSVSARVVQSSSLSLGKFFRVGQGPRAAETAAAAFAGKILPR